MEVLARYVTAKAEDMMPTAVTVGTSAVTARIIHSVTKIPSGSFLNMDKIPISINDSLW